MVYPRVRLGRVEHIMAKGREKLSHIYTVCLWVSHHGRHVRPVIDEDRRLVGLGHASGRSNTVESCPICLCESAIMVVTCRLDTDKDRRVVGLRGGRVESSVWLGKGREKLSHVYTVSLWINQTKHWKVLGWVGLGEVVESAIMVVTLDQRWLVLSTGWVGFGQAFGRSNAVESCPSLPSWSSRTRWRSDCCRGARCN